VIAQPLGLVATARFGNGKGRPLGQERRDEEDENSDRLVQPQTPSSLIDDNEGRAARKRFVDNDLHILKTGLRVERARKS